MTSVNTFALCCCRWRVWHPHLLALPDAHIYIPRLLVQLQSGGSAKKALRLLDCLAFVHCVAATWWVCNACPFASLTDCLSSSGQNAMLHAESARIGSSLHVSASFHCQTNDCRDSMTSPCRAPSTTSLSAASLTSLRAPQCLTLSLR